MMSGILQDLRVAQRTLARNRGPAFVIVLTLAVTIAAVTVIISTIDMTWHMLPVADRDGLVLVASTDSRRMQAQAGGAGAALRAGVSIPDLVDWSTRTSTFDRLSALAFGGATLTDTGVPLRVSTARVTADLLPTWGVSPVLGRTFRTEEGRPGAQPVALLTHAFWQNQLGGQPTVLGQTVTLDGTAHTIVGVLPERASIGFFRQTDLMVPLSLDPLRSARDERTLFVTGKLKPGITRAQAAADLSAIAQTLQREHPATNEHIGAMVQPLIEASGMNVRFLIFVLGLIAALLGAMACTNVANVILAQAMSRRHELAVRAALGASRLRRVRQLMVEHLLTSLAGGIGGVALAWAAIALLRRLAGGAFGFGEMEINERVLFASVAVSLLAPLGFGLLPALRLSRVAPDELRAAGRSAGARRGGRLTRNIVTPLQVGIAMVLMIQIGLLARTAWRLSTLDAGLDPAQLLTFRVDLSGSQHASPEATNRFVRHLMERLESLPGVASAGITDRLPIADREQTVAFSVEGMPSELKPVAARAAVSSRYLQTMRISLIRGREISEADVIDGSAVALVNAEAARRYWQGADPIGRRVAFESGDWLTIIGIAANVRNSDADQGPLPEVYVPSSRRPTPAMAVVVRSEGPDPVRLVPSIRAQVAHIDRALPIFDVASMNQVMFDDLAGTLVLVTMLGTIAVVAICLAASGVYGVVSQAVAQRTREIGVRIALGASPRAVVRMVMGQGTVPILSGAALGLALALALAYAISASITEVEFRDPLNYIAVTAAILLVTLAASYLPARRASRVDPMVILRYE
jgi:putative ABC transport system permease protein